MGLFKTYRKGAKDATTSLFGTMAPRFTITPRLLAETLLYSRESDFCVPGKEAWMEDHMDLAALRAQAATYSEADLREAFKWTLSDRGIGESMLLYLFESQDWKHEDLDAIAEGIVDAHADTLRDLFIK